MIKTYRISTLEKEYDIDAINIVLAIKKAMKKYRLKINEIFKAWEIY